jgi:hypothetical protein
MKISDEIFLTGFVHKKTNLMDELCHRITEQVEIGLTETCDIDMFADHPIKDECPVCTNPLPLEERESIFTTCCGQLICGECVTATKERCVSGHLCPFCREGGQNNEFASIKAHARRGNCHAAIYVSEAYRTGENGVEESRYHHLKWLVTAASNGSDIAYGMLSQCYLNGIVVGRSELKRCQCLEIAAKKGDITARRSLAKMDREAGDMERAMKHMEVAACAGCTVSLSNVFQGLREGIISKIRVDEVIKKHQANCDR